MHEDFGKYSSERAPRTQTSPLVDSPVQLFAGRTAPEIALPLFSGILLMIVAEQLWLALIVPPVLFVAMPWFRQHLGRGRMLHLLWSLGAVRHHRLPVFAWDQPTKLFGP